MLTQDPPYFITKSIKNQNTGFMRANIIYDSHIVLPKQSQTNIIYGIVNLKLVVYEAFTTYWVNQD